MKEESKSFLETNMHHWEAWRDLQIFNQLDYGVRDGFLKVIRDEFNPGYLANLWCSPCVVDMMRYVYTQYDKYLSQNKIQE
jgi:hypothetical protein